MKFHEFKTKFEKVPVEIFPNKVPNNPVVSVCVQTYQHVNYVRQCLDSILMQKTHFPFEILLGEDESTDGTREICIEYAKNYPEKIKLLLHKRKNTIFRNGSPIGRFNFLYNLYNSKGKYIALCDGDDYWIDPLKLQKQVDFMEKNPNYAFSVGKIKHFLQSKNIFIDPGNLHVNPDKNENYLLEDYLFNRFSQTATFLFRNNLKGFDFPKWFLNCAAADQPLVALITGSDKIKYHNDYFSVYRIHPTSATHSVNSKFYYKDRFELFQNINIHFGLKYNKIIKFRIKLFKIQSFARQTNSKLMIGVLNRFCDMITIAFYKKHRDKLIKSKL